MRQVETGNSFFIYWFI